MFGQKVKQTFVGTAAATALWLAMSAVPANAVPTPLNAWNLNLSVINGTAWDFGGAGSPTGLVDINNIDQVILSGSSTITQTVVGGDAHGQAFADRGFLRLGLVDHEFPTPQDDVGDYLTGGVGFGKRIYFTFGTVAAGGNGAGAGSTDLTGKLKADDTIKFDAGVGTITLWLDSDTDLNPTTGKSKILATFALVTPSGGSDLDFFGGAAANATIDITLTQLTQASDLTGALYTDLGGNDLFNPFTVHLGDVDSKLDNNFNPNPDNSGIDGFGNGDSIIHVNNAGQYNIASVPEPGTLSLLGFGLLISGFVARRRKAA